MLANMAERDQYVGKFVTGKIHSGVLKKGDNVRGLYHAGGEG